MLISASGVWASGVCMASGDWACCTRATRAAGVTGGLTDTNSRVASAGGAISSRGRRSAAWDADPEVR